MYIVRTPGGPQQPSTEQPAFINSSSSFLMVFGAKESKQHPGTEQMFVQIFAQNVIKESP